MGGLSLAAFAMMEACSAGCRNQDKDQEGKEPEEQGEEELLPFSEGETFTAISVGDFVLCGLRLDGAPLCQVRANRLSR